MRFLNYCLALLFALLPSSFAFAGEQQWVEVRSPNFSVITDAGEKRGRRCGSPLRTDAFRLLGKLMVKANVNLSVPLQIVAFRNSKELRQMAPIFNGKPTEMAGLFQGGDDRTFIMLDMSVDNPWTVVFHEYAHQLMNGNLSERIDPWFEEGFAEYFSSIEVDNKEARVGKIPEDTYRILQQNEMMRIVDLFGVQQYSKTYNESGDHRNTFYAESGLLVHYLYDKQLMLKVADYFDARLSQKQTVEQAIQKAFGMTPEEFDKLLRDYLHKRPFRDYPMPTPAGIVAAQFTATPVSLADAQAVLADIDAHSRDHHDRALAEFKEVLRTDPDNASALHARHGLRLPAAAGFRAGRRVLQARCPTRHKRSARPLLQCAADEPLGRDFWSRQLRHGQERTRDRHCPSIESWPTPTRCFPPMRRQPAAIPKKASRP